MPSSGRNWRHQAHLSKLFRFKLGFAGSLLKAGRKPPARRLKVLRQETIQYAPVGPDLSGSWPRLLRVFGPGAIIASVTVGTGETFFAPRVGAVFGYAMLWVPLDAVVFKTVQVYAGARYIVLTGEHPLRAWSRIPGPRAWVA